jgi:hypothetical protein
MFGKKKFDDAEKSIFADRIALILSVQLVTVPRRAEEITQIEISEGQINRKAIGYIYGFVDCALQHRGMDITDISVGIPILFHVMRKLFPGHEQAYISFLMHDMDDETTVLGMMTGGQEYSEFLRENGTPFGLGRFIWEGRRL